MVILESFLFNLIVFSLRAVVVAEREEEEEEVDRLEFSDSD